VLLLEPAECGVGFATENCRPTSRRVAKILQATYEFSHRFAAITTLDLFGQ
jgi:hypothetical protein